MEDPVRAARSESVPLWYAPGIKRVRQWVQARGFIAVVGRGRNESVTDCWTNLDVKTEHSHNMSNIAYCKYWPHSRRSTGRLVQADGLCNGPCEGLGLELI